ARRGTDNFRARLCIRLAGRDGGPAARGARIDLCASRTRLCALLAALTDAQPLLRASAGGREGRELVGRSVLGRTEAAARPRNRDGAEDGAVNREIDRAAPQLRGRTAAVRPAVPCRG